ncbi:TPA: ferrochelatase, partial [Campylobacter jejuni]|nr:ferrochelatase [Campylobacter jejuni]
MKLVLFLNMGGATNLQDCEVFLKNMFNDPYILGIKNRFLRKFVAWIITKARVKAMQENYKKMGGKSPLNELTQSLCDKLNLKQD